MAFSVIISFPWIHDLAKIVTYPIAIAIISGISYIPGYLNAFLIISLLFDKQPKFKNENPTEPVTILIAAFNEEKRIYNTLKYIKNQDYHGKITILVIDNASNDQTVAEVNRAIDELQLNIKLLHEKRRGKFYALNYGLQWAKTNFVITLDADTILHSSAVRNLIARIESSPNDVAAVAGSILVRNSRENLWTKIQEWDYFLGIASIKRLQGLYQGTLVAQGAFSIYRIKDLKEIGGWPNAIGEDIVVTWRLLEKKRKIYFEPLAVAFTDVPASLIQFIRQRSRWARGMIEGLQAIKPWEQPQLYTKYLTGVNLIMPFLDITYTLFWIPGLILALFGHYWIVGPMTLLVLPLTLISFGVLYLYQKRFVFRPLNLKIRNNTIGFICFILFYQIIMSPVSTYGYIQEFLKMERKWK
ncbi:glycosyl transferase [Heyndrickxia sporothermodurans]|nr:glycosyltransferase [Heyndrickxia sporothermodurans]MBL5767182.1 glycosyltransferase family 2 protein [Heyndrickxia sporothermodurans]MBL5770681.1 glycosyltransferase family 2 protein [Heyndrickxia sporothermodurans]MBL5774333.1 glycosyltransferase family 2 protein [Heyndrickxia sporothermodurans]MBL5778447.1 glycosyltransferase family 2 protein [Heyndrickxia sporothermodurans]MBL5781453.1 glycosyltransferase family 2 protein [Heyndrickxia sporothermodurans]